MKSKYFESMKDLGCAAEQMALVANKGDLRGVASWALGLCCKCLEKLTDEKTAEAFCSQTCDLLMEHIGRHENVDYTAVTMDDIFEAARLDALDDDGIEWRAFCEIFRETSAPEITHDNARAIDAAARGTCASSASRTAMNCAASCGDDSRIAASGYPNNV